MNGIAGVPTAIASVLLLGDSSVAQDPVPVSANRAQVLLRDGDAPVRGQAIHTLVDLGVIDSAKDIATLLRDPDRRVRRPAVFGSVALTLPTWRVPLSIS